MTKMASLMVLIMTIITVGMASSKASLTLPATSSGETLGVFEMGKLETKQVKFDKVNKSDESSLPPEPLLVVSPTKPGSYPVLFFIHGCMMSNQDYTEIYKRVASHGFIVVAPKLWTNPLSPPCQLEEIEMATTTINWLPSNLNDKLPTDVKGDLTKFAVSGHSRGGKTAFALALGLTVNKLKVKISALIAVDPVAGPSEEERTKPHILTYRDNSIDLSIPVTVIGTGLGKDKNLGMPPCAPKCCSHQQFFNELKQGTHFVIENYGHTDVLNGFSTPPFLNPDQIASYAATFVCRNKPERPWSKIPMKRTVSGIIVAFLNTYFRHDSTDYLNILEDPSVAPVQLSPPNIKSQSGSVLRYGAMSQTY